MDEETIDITAILNEEKRFVDDHAEFPSLHEAIKLSGIGQVTQYEYLIDINRKYCQLNRITYHQRVFTNTTIIRFDSDTKPHQNPDGKKIDGTHIHVYRHGFGDSWAYELNDPVLRRIWPGFDFSALTQGDLVNKFWLCHNKWLIFDEK